VTGPLSVGSIRLYDEIDPVLTAGVYRVTSGAVIANASNPASQLPPPPPDHTHIDVGGPRFRLGPADVPAVHPPAGARGNFSNRLPHIVLGRRTLPFERRITGGAPWLALLVARKSTPDQPGEVTLASGGLQAMVGQAVYNAINAAEPADPQEPVTVATFTQANTLRSLLPTAHEITLLTHVRQVNVADTALDLGDDDGWFAVVAANRLPRATGGGDAGTPYVAMLVSLEARADIWSLPASGPAPPLIVLTSWEFTAAPGGTFEELAAELDLGLVGGPATLERTDRSGGQSQVAYRGPLAGTLAPGPADLDDVGLAAAFELGRLLGAADGRFTREIVGWHRDLDLQARSAMSEQVVADALDAHPALRARQAPAARSLSLHVGARLLAHAAERHNRAEPWGVHPAAAHLVGRQGATPSTPSASGEDA
jgi:hypothetical protein